MKIQSLKSQIEDYRKRISDIELLQSIYGFCENRNNQIAILSVKIFTISEALRIKRYKENNSAYRKNVLKD